MCGIFAYVGDGSDPDILRAVAKGAAQRGPHGYGWVADGEVTHELGEMDLDRLPQAKAVVGHARLCTIGRNDVHGLQPWPVGGHVFAHNGNVYNHRELWPDKAPSDSAAIANLYARLRDSGEDPESALCEVVAESQQIAWAIVVLDRDGSLVAHRHYQPLHALRHDTGIYVSSVPFDGSLPLEEGFTLLV